MSSAVLGSTYRLQIRGVGFCGARELVAYLRALGIDTLYVSPIFSAVPGSTHGYDVTDPECLDPVLGTSKDFEDLLATLAEHEMRLLIDIVPNHLAVHATNAWWWDILRRGPSSPFATTFDIDWRRYDGRVLVPTLSRPLNECIDDAQLDGTGTEHTLLIDHQRFPLDPSGPQHGDPATLLDEQSYLPAFWRRGHDDGNYRRFFDIDGLIGVRVEDPDVFQRVHRGVAALANDERIVGWRVDHVDGLADPRTYLSRLREMVSTGRRTRPVVVIEKILAQGEALSSRWDTDGTTGYEFSTVVGGLFVDEAGVRVLERVSADLEQITPSYEEIRLSAKREVLAASLFGTLERLVDLTLSTLQRRTPGHDLTRREVRAALRELTVHLRVYRTYEGSELGPDDATSFFSRALRDARREASGEELRALDVVGGLLDHAHGDDVELVRRWQQLSGAVMAKGEEDTATYRYVGPLGHADVGCDPSSPATSPSEFHRFAKSRVATPSSLNATSTHDSKRSEDARSRLYALTEFSSEWATLLRRWHHRHEAFVRDVGPDTRSQLVAYQSFLCLWPNDSVVSRPLLRRLSDYAIKAAREAKDRTTWTDPNVPYERALVSFCASLAGDDRFVGEMGRFMRAIGPCAVTNSLATVALKCVAPGTPDFYQGSELWDLSLTDPDNRRPIDFRLRQRVLEGLASGPARGEERVSEATALLADWPSGALKLYVTRELLQLRHDEPDLFEFGAYVALEVRGDSAAHVVALARRRQRQWIIALVPRGISAIAGSGNFALGDSAWGSARLSIPARAPRDYQNVFTGETLTVKAGRLDVANCLERFPICVLQGGR